jgi:peptidoglycan/xylan/chitin deacetylase (PgdA/CDA1 family)
VVTFTFDDGNADTVTAAPIMNAVGYHGTYYTNSGTIGLPGYQTLADLQNLAATGNEIAGHTVNHPDLPTLPTAEAEREICLDRDNLLGWGFTVTDFAYPFADTNATIDGLAKTCGYNSARNLGDIQSRFGCAGCEYAETIPPANAYELAALDEADDTWTLQDFENAVTNAQNNGGGWVILTFHHICDNTCDPLAVTPELFTQFVQWMQTQTSNPAEKTSVETVQQVIGGPLNPPVVLPPAVSSANVTNPSLETLDTTTNLPTCWSEAGYGTNTATWALVTPGHTGNVAAQLTMSAYTDGDAKVIPTLDLGTCTPAATPGQSYQLSTWYESTAQTQYDVYIRTLSGAWVYWTSSPFFGGASAWTQSTWVTPPVPAGYNGIDFGLTLESVGTLTTDDYNIAPAATPLTTTATVTPINPNGANGWYNSQPTVTLSVANDGIASTTSYSYDNATWLPYTGTVTIPTGRSTFYYRSQTATVTEATQSLTFAVDTDLPTVIAAFSTTARTFSAFGADATSGPNQIRYSFDAGVTWNNYTAPVTVDNAGYSVEVESIDAAGNISLPVTITEPPVTTATVVPAVADGLAGWYKTSPTVTLAAGATPPVGQVTYYSYDGVTFLPYTAPLVVADGNRTLSYYTVGAGQTEPTHTLTLNVDSTPPVVSPSFDPTTNTYSVIATDAASGVASIQENINNAGWITYPGPTGTNGATLSILFRATDIAGNVSASVPLSIGGVSATTLAAVTPATPNGAAGWYTSAPQVLLSASGTVTDQVIQYAINNGAWTTYTGGVTIGAGISSFEYRTIGNGYTEATHTLNFSVDLDNPTVIPAFNSTTRTWSATDSDATSGPASIQVRAAGTTAWTTYTGPVTIGNGSLSLEFQATDVAGHTSTIVPLTAGPITTAAVSPATPNGTNGWYKTTPQVTLSTGAASLGSPASGQVTQYSYDGTNWVTYTGSIAIPDGTVTLSYRSSGAGFTEATKSIALKTDTIAPTVTPLFNSTTRTYSATASDANSGIASIEVSSNNGTLWSTYSAPVAVGNGTVSLLFRATDNAGNVSANVALTPGAAVTATILPAAPNGSAGWYISAPTVTLSSTTLGVGETIQYSLNGTTWVNYTSAVTLPAGADALQYRSSTATIAAGTVSANVDLANPTVNPSFNSSTRTVTVTAGDVGSGVASISWRVSGATAWTAYTAPLQIGTAAQTLQFESTDVSGRVSAVSSLSIAKGAGLSTSAVTLTIDPASVPYLQSGTARVSVVSGGKFAVGNVTITVDGKAYKTVMLFAGGANVKLSRTLAVGTHTVVASYAGSTTSLAATSSTATLTVAKAKTVVVLTKASASTLASKATGHLKKASTSGHAVTVSVRIVGSKSLAKGKIVITANGKKVRTISLSSASSGKFVVNLPAFSKKFKKVTIQARFLGTKSLKAAKSKKYVLHLHK